MVDCSMCINRRIVPDSIGRPIAQAANQAHIPWSGWNDRAHRIGTLSFGRRLYRPVVSHLFEETISPRIELPLAHFFRYFDELNYSNASHYVKLRAAVLNNPVQIADSSEQALDYTEKGNYIYPVSCYFLKILLAIFRIKKIVPHISWVCFAVIWPISAKVYDKDLKT